MSNFLPNKTYWMASISWSNPYTVPDSGIKHLWGCCIPAPCDANGVSSHAILDHLLKTQAIDIITGSGYSVCLDVMCDIKPRKKWSPGAKAKNRKKRMIDRARKKDPLFADWVIQNKLISNPDYFDPEKIKEQSTAHDARMADRHEKYQDDFIKKSISSASPDQLRMIKRVMES